MCDSTYIVRPSQFNEKRFTERQDDIEQRIMENDREIRVAGSIEFVDILSILRFIL